MRSAGTTGWPRFAAVLACAAFLAIPSGPGRADVEPIRIVAIGDIHGELEGFSALLRKTGLVDEEGSWAGGRDVLVQLGDFLDRGAEVRGVMDLLRRLQEEAGASGGEVVVLMGNHEGMNVVAAMRDVSPAAVARFATDDSEALRRRGLEEWETWLADRARWRGEVPPDIGDRERREWLEGHPPGWIEYMEAVGPDGDYGRWIRELPIAVVRGDTLFMHAGLSPEWADVAPEEINRRHRAAFEASDRARSSLIDRGLAPFWADREAIYETLLDLREALEREDVQAPLKPRVFQALATGFDGARWTTAPASPLWFRGYAEWPDESLGTHVDEILEKQGVARLAGGHSPSDSHTVVRRAGGRVFLIDTGMLTSHYGGRGAALVLTGDDVTVVYGDGDPAPEARAPATSETEISATGGDSGGAGAGPDPEEGPPSRVFRNREGEPLPFEDDEAILAFLGRAGIVESRPLNVGVTGARILVLEHEGRRLRAVFHDVDKKKLGPTRLTGAKGTMHFLDSHRSQVAAYELARLMGFRTVPPTISRTVERAPGSIQLWIEGATTWREIKSSGESIPTRYRWQLDDMWVFDNLIGNTDRNQGNILFDGDGNLWWIDHTRAFSADGRLPSPERIRRVSRRLWTAIRELDGDGVRGALSEHLSKQEMKALLSRRDRLVRLIEDRLAAEGEDRVLFDLDAPPAAVTIGFEPID